MTWLYGALIWLAYLVPLKRWANSLQRWLLERNAETAPLDSFESPEELELAIRKMFVWRPDSRGRTLKFWDWSSKPEVFQARLNDVEEVGDGDCDDVHAWAAHILRRMRGVTNVMLLSVGYRNPNGGHTVCVYNRAGRWYLLNYRVSLLDDPNDAPKKVVDQMRGVDEGPRWYVFENLDYRRVASGPRGQVKCG